MNHQIPIIDVYRGVGLHDQQDTERLSLVRSEIDAVFAAGGEIPYLLDWVANRGKSPESRLLAKAMILAHIEAASEQRRTRPAVDVDWLHAITGHLDSVKWRSRTHYDGGMGPRPMPGDHPRNAVRRPVPLA